MKRFLLKVFFATIFALLVAVSVIALRIALAQKAVDVAFDVPPGTEVVFIGNSHTGCSWTEAPEFRDRVSWFYSAGFAFHYLRFLEFERRGVFDRAVKACVVDCDKPALDGFSRDMIKRSFISAYPFAWRYIDEIPLSLFERLFLMASIDVSFGLQGVPFEEGPPWTTFTTDYQEKLFERDYGMRVYGGDWRIPLDWDSDSFPCNWQVRFYEMVADMKARCDRHGVRLILFASPLVSNDPGRANAVVSNRVSAVAEKIRSMGIEYYDYREAFPDDKFRDSNHLQPSSAYDFTKKFYAEVLKLPVGK